MSPIEQPNYREASRREAPERRPGGLTCRGRIAAGMAAVSLGFTCGIVDTPAHDALRAVGHVFDGKENCVATNTPIVRLPGESDWDMAARVTGERPNKGLLQMESANPGWKPGVDDNQTLYAPECE